MIWHKINLLSQKKNDRNWFFFRSSKNYINKLSAVTLSRVVQKKRFDSEEIH